jgi:DNA-binding NtrC family response regulator
MIKVRDRIRRAALVDSPVFIWGEAGTGKTDVAQTIHQQSRRADGPFIIMRPDALRAGGVRAEAADAGGQSAEPAISTYGSRLKAARGGTLLIDEITRLSRTWQAKLLEAAEGRPRAVPRDPEPKPGDFRVMATSRHEPSESMDRGLVREDLYYRLAVVTIRVPSLRERKEDIVPLVEGILAEICADRDRPVPTVAPDLMEYLEEKPWPGNISQLRECLEKVVGGSDAAVLGLNDFWAVHSPPENDSPHAASAERIDTLAELEREAVMRALKVCHSNRTQAARMLGISVRTLQRKLRQWGK